MKRKKGFFSTFKILLQKNRLGELMVMSGLLTSGELRLALARQRTTGDHLGRVLISDRMVSRQDLYRVLAQQWTLRCMAGTFTLFLAFSSFGIKSARAGSIRDVPSQISLAQAAGTAFSPVRAYPALFGSAERRSGNLSAFIKWTDMFDRFESALKNPEGQRVVKEWQARLRPFAGQGIEQMARGVNEVVNRQDYIVDDRNWGKSDYWETPVEFFQRGGDCEDFAIAKYASLRALGVPEDRMRIAIVHDEQKNMPHALLIVYSDSAALVLDNQSSEVRTAESLEGRYRPIFTINRMAWWIHTAPGATVLASAR